MPQTSRPLRVADRWYQDKRIGGLARFALAITFLNLLGHLWLGFEQSWATPFVALAAAYGTEIALELVAARSTGTRPRFLGGGLVGLVSFLLSAHVSALAIGMLLMPLEQLWVVAFAASAAMASKRLAVARLDGRLRHFLNPSNFGITLVLLLFPSVGIAPPYQFAKATGPVLDVLLPLIVIGTGSLLNTKFTGRMTLIGAWVAAFAGQAVLRALVHDTPVVAGLMPMTGFAFILFTFYMITDPATSPARQGGQVGFALAVAGLYALFMELGIVFGLFYALTVVTLLRGLWFGLDLAARLARLRIALAPVAGSAQ